MSSRDPEALVAVWCNLDRRAALVEADREVVEASRPLRATIAGFALAGGSDEEIYDACAALGRLIAQRGGSPTLASATIDNAGEALGVRPAAWLAPGRAAVAEAFTRAVLERAHQEALHGWEFPRCAVLLPGGVIVIAAGFPSDDPELLADWAARIAKAAALKGVRQAFVSGPDAPRAAVEDALDVVGIEVARQAGSRT
jgi:hypothetical protein